MGLNQDGTAEETLNHVGRHELGGTYTDGSFTADPNLTYYVDQNLHANRLYIRGDGGLFHLREDPTRPGDFLATDAQEFGTATGGTLMRLTGAPSINPEDMVLTAVTPTSADAQVPQQTGYFRNPLPMSDGTLIAVHTPATGQLQNLGNTASPNWSYQYRVKLLTKQGSFWAPSGNLTSGIQKNVSWWTPDVLAAYNGILWELDPVEVATRPVPVARQSVLPSIEAAVFNQEAVDVASFQAYLRANGLALIVSRNVTQRDRADRHQPFNLQVPGGVSSIATGGSVYDVAYLQIFEGDAVRGYGDVANPNRGRRLLARPMHGAAVSQAPSAPPGAVVIAPDGSVAALVPARRALSWQLTDAGGAGVVRERNWISLQAGEIRVCASCHGVNRLSQTGDPPPTNEPGALHDLLTQWKRGQSGSPGAATATPTPMRTPTATATGTKTATPNSSATFVSASATPTPAADPGSGACTSGIAIENARLRASFSTGTMRVLGRTLVTPPVALQTDGVRLTVDGVLDVIVPGGFGWTVGSTGKHWRFDDPTGQLGGVRRIDVRDSAQTPGRLAFEVRMVGAPLLPTIGPLDFSLRVGQANQCARAHWNGSNAPRPRCQANAQRLTCG